MGLGVSSFWGYPCSVVFRGNNQANHHLSGSTDNTTSMCVCGYIHIVTNNAGCCPWLWAQDSFFPETQGQRMAKENQENQQEMESGPPRTKRTNGWMVRSIHLYSTLRVRILHSCGNSDQASMTIPTRSSMCCFLCCCFFWDGRGKVTMYFPCF